MEGYFEKGVYHSPPKQIEEIKMVIKVELEGYEEVKSKLNELCDMVSRTPHPDQVTLEYWK